MLARVALRAKATGLLPLLREEFANNPTIDIVRALAALGDRESVLSMIGLLGQTHGNMDQRGPGAIGMHTYPGRVFKGKHMATRWGGERVTSKNHKVVGVKPEDNLLLVRGSIPGSRNGLVLVRTARSEMYVPKG